MQVVTRRALVTAVALLPTLLLPRRAQATLFRGLPLRALVAQSQHVLLLTALGSRCVYAQIAGRRAIVTETRLRVEDVVAKAIPNQGELVVRTLGGVLDGVGELVHGQAEFSREALCLAFLTRSEDESLWVNGMAQGHYPILGATAAEPYLVAGPHVPVLRDVEHSAFRALVGQKLAAARRLVIEANAP